MAAQTPHQPQIMHPAEAHHLLNPLRRLIQSPRRLVRLLELRPDSAVLDLGSGPGYFAPHVARSVPQGKLVLVDVQQQMLDMARAHLEDQGLANIEYVMADAASLPFADDSFDVVFMVAALHEVADRAACLREIRRVLRPQGLLLITELRFGDPYVIAKPEMLKLVQAAGFALSAQRGLGLSYTLTLRAPATA